MEAMRQGWTDNRMDDLAQRVDVGFAQARVDVDSTRENLRREIREQGKELRGEIQDLRVQMDARFDALHAILAANQRTMLLMCGGLCAALIAAVATLVSTTV